MVGWLEDWREGLLYVSPKYVSHSPRVLSQLTAAVCCQCTRDSTPPGNVCVCVCLCIRNANRVCPYLYAFPSVRVHGRMPKRRKKTGKRQRVEKEHVFVSAPMRGLKFPSRAHRSAKYDFRSRVIAAIARVCVSVCTRIPMTIQVYIYTRSCTWCLLSRCAGVQAAVAAVNLSGGA